MSLSRLLRGAGITAGLCAPLPATAHGTAGLALIALGLFIGVPLLLCFSGLCIYLFFSRRPLSQKIAMLALYACSALLLGIAVLVVWRNPPDWPLFMIGILPLAVVTMFAIMRPPQVDVPDKH